jgi:hypothetical protein
VIRCSIYELRGSGTTIAPLEEGVRGRRAASAFPKPALQWISQVVSAVGYQAQSRLARQRSRHCASAGRALGDALPATTCELLLRANVHESLADSP